MNVLEELDNDNRFTWTIMLALVIAFACSIAQLRADEPAARIAVIDAQITAKQNARPDLPHDFDKGNGQADPTNTGAGPLKFEAAVSLLGTLRELLGPSGRVTLNPDAPLVIERPEAKVTIQRGTEISYQFSQSTGILTFPGTKPKLDAKVLGLRVTPNLTRLEIAADNSGVASVESGPIKLSRRFCISWEEAPPYRATANESPPITFYSSEGCGPCVADKKAIANSPLRGLIRIVEIDRVPHRHEAANGKPYTIFGTPTFIWTGSDEVDHNVFSFAELQRYWKPP